MKNLSNTLEWHSRIREHSNIGRKIVLPELTVAASLAFIRVLMPCFLFLFCMAAWQVNAQNTPVGQQNRKRLVIAIDENYLPQTFLNIEGQPSGIFVDIWRLWAKKTGTDITFLTGNWNDSLANLKSKAADIHSGLFYSDARAEWIGFSKPFYGVGSYFFSLADSEKSDKSDKIDPQKELAGKRIGATAGSFQEEYLCQKYPKAEVVAFTNREEMIRAVLHKKIDALLAEGPAIQAVLDRFGLTGQFNAGALMFSKSFHAGVLKENSDLLSLVNKGFDAISEKELAEIEKRWIFDPYRQYFKSELAYVLDAIPALVWIARDPECRVITGNRYVNETFNVADNTNVSQTAAKKGKALKIIHLSPGGRELQPEELPMQLSIARKEPVLNMEFTYLLPDGRRINAISNAVPLFDEYGQVRGSVCAVLDITETKKAAASLQNRTQMFLIASVGFIAVLGVMLLIVARMWRTAKQTADAIRESEALLSTAGRTVRFGGWSAAPDGQKIVWSEQVAVIHEKEPGYSPTLEEAIGYYAPEWKEKITTVFESCVREGEPFDEEMEIITGGGHRLWVRTTGEADRDKSGRIIRVHGSFQDITERKQAEEALRESEEAFKGYFNMGTVGMCVTSPEKGWVEVNERLCQILGYSRDELIHMTWSEMTHPDDLLADVELFNQVLDDAFDSYNLEKRFIRKDGQIVYTMLYVTSQRNPDRTVKYILASLLDITERKQAEAALRQSEKRFRSLFEGSRDGFVIVNASGAFIDANSAYCNMLGYTLDELRAMKDFYQITPEKWREWETEEVWENRLLRKGYSGLYEKEYIRKDGSVFPVELNSFTLRNQTGEIEYLWGVARDITERKRVEKSLRELEAEKQRVQKLESVGLLAGGIAHDFNNMLNIISGNISYVLSELGQHDELRDVLNDVQTGTKQAQKLTQQLLTFARGGAPIKKEADLRKILKESALFVTRGANVRCDFEFPEDLWTAPVDTGQMNQAVSNLLINAVQAMPEGGMIQIKAENQTVFPENSMFLTSGSYVKISLKDNGIGIAEKHISKIFDPYFTTKQKGRGLGLATSYSIIKGHNGNISVESELGAGTTFYIYLPAADKKTVTDHKQASGQHKGHGRILLMDDEQMILDMTGRLLKSMGYETSFAKDGKQAIEMYKQAFLSQQPFDLVILDLTVPGGMGGAKTIPELLKIDSNVKAVVSSGYSNDPIMGNYQDYGFCGVIPKPYTKAELGEVLSKIW